MYSREGQNAHSPAAAEAALGADMVADAESRELVEKGFLTSSCCPGFVSYIEKDFPELKPYISHNLSPMATIARYLKEHDATAKVVFIGPCTAKKGEAAKQEVRPYVDAAMTFEELQALFDSREIDITALEEGMLDEASYFGRIFARCGGLAEAVAQGIKEHGHTDFELKATSCDGIEQCRIALFKKSKKLLRFTLDDGTGTDRQILSGIAKFYEPETLVGKTLAAIINLPPRKMMGQESCGMLLSAVHKEKGEEKLNLLMLNDAIPAGAKLC